MVGRAAERGVTYLALLILVAVVSALLAASAQIVSQAQQRERERHLLWVGDQYRRAILEYGKFAAGVDTYPRELADLLEDKRQPLKRRHLRRLYFDPMTGSNDWGLVLNPQQRIIGVYSKSRLKPVRTHGFRAPYVHFAKAKTYAGWIFTVGEVKPDTEGEALVAPPPEDAKLLPEVTPVPNPTPEDAKAVPGVTEVPPQPEPPQPEPAPAEPPPEPEPPPAEPGN